MLECLAGIDDSTPEQEERRRGRRAKVQEEEEVVRKGRKSRVMAAPTSVPQVLHLHLLLHLLLLLHLHQDVSISEPRAPLATSTTTKLPHSSDPLTQVPLYLYFTFIPWHGFPRGMKVEYLV